MHLFSPVVPGTLSLRRQQRHEHMLPSPWYSLRIPVLVLAARSDILEPLQPPDSASKYSNI